MNKRRIGQILVLGCLLSACGGGGGSVEARNLNSSRDDRAGDSTGGSREGGEEDRRNNESDENRDEDRGDDNGNNAGGGGGIGTQAGDYAVLGFNDLGMHCADLDYSTFVILPPFNVVRSQVIRRGAEPSILDNQQVDVTYQAVADASGSINTTSQNPADSVFKSNFWEINPDTGRMYVTDLFGLSPQKDEGLLGQRMPGIGAPYSANDPQSFDFQNDGMGWFSADGVPILPVDDAGHANAYPLMRLSAKDKSGNALGSVDVVLPVASEADCQTCHAIGLGGRELCGRGLCLRRQ